MQAKVVCFIGHAILEEVAVADERITRVTIRSVKHVVVLVHLRCVQTLQSRDSIVDLTNVNAFKVIATSSPCDIL